MIIKKLFYREVLCHSNLELGSFVCLPDGEIQEKVNRAKTTGKGKRWPENHFSSTAILVHECDGRQTRSAQTLASLLHSPSGNQVISAFRRFDSVFAQWLPVTLRLPVTSALKKKLSQFTLLNRTLGIWTPATKEIWVYPPNFVSSSLNTPSLLFFCLLDMDGNYKKTTWKKYIFEFLWLSANLWALLSPSQVLFATLYSFQGKLASRDNNLAFFAHPLLYLPETLSFFFPFSSAFLTYLINSFIVTHREEAFYRSHHWHWPGSWFIICDTGEKHAHTNLYSWSSHLYSPNRYDTIDLTYPGSSRALSFGNIFFSIVRKKNSIWEEKKYSNKTKANNTRANERRRRC